MGKTGVQSPRSRKPEGKDEPDELEKIRFWSTYCSRHDGGDVSPAERRCAAGRFFGAVSFDGRSMGDFRVALRETQITRLRLQSPLNHLLPIGQVNRSGSGHAGVLSACSLLYILKHKGAALQFGSTALLSSKSHPAF